jgi:hypothetical protein
MYELYQGTLAVQAAGDGRGTIWSISKNFMTRSSAAEQKKL